jgi:hypothetical protein
MPKHKKDKGAKSVSQQVVGPHQETNPTVAGVRQEDGGENKAFQQQDLTRRLGDYEGTGNHARTGNPGISERRHGQSLKCQRRGSPTSLTLRLGIAPVRPPDRKVTKSYP